MRCQYISTPFGSFEAQWHDGGLAAFQFCCDQEVAARGQEAEVEEEGPMRRLREAIDGYLSSGNMVWDMEWLDMAGVSPFFQSVYRATAEIPSGTTVSYARLAQLAGRPAAARAAGTAMARNRWPLLIPCHRVIGSNGQLTGYSGEGGIATKRRLLAFERSMALEAGESARDAKLQSVAT